MKQVVFFLFVTMNLSVFAQVSENTTNGSEGAMSMPKRIYLEKKSVIDMYLNAIDNKWNIIINDPVEDSIAKAEGWYDFMSGRRIDLNNQLLAIRVEQLQNYYTLLNDLLVSAKISQVDINELLSQRLLFAPSYPLEKLEMPNDDSQRSALELWILDNLNEYELLIGYMEKLVI